jgi:hypothetical protein
VSQINHSSLAYVRYLIYRFYSCGITDETKPVQVALKPLQLACGRNLAVWRDRLEKPEDVVAELSGGVWQELERPAC